MQQNHSHFILIIGVVFGLFLDINPFMASEKKFETFNPESVRTWSFFSDGVMGGVSTGKALLKKSGRDNFVRIEGNVSTDNNGGFIQIRHNLIKPLNETTKGLRLKVRGNGERYYIFIRTRSTLLPWQFYNIEFPTSKEWSFVDLEFAKFKRSSGFIRKTFKSSSIKSIGIVAYGRDHSAKVDVSEIDFF